VTLKKDSLFKLQTKIFKERVTEVNLLVASRTACIS